MIGPSLCVSVTFLDSTFHGRRDAGIPEWPPSPMRLFQALVATAGRMEPTGLSDTTTAALKWLERRSAPSIFAPAAWVTAGRRTSVPNNAMDIVARAWSRGNESEKGDADPRTHRTMKNVRPLWLQGECVSFMWVLEENPVEIAGHVEILKRLARSVSSLGWGIDLVVGDANVVNDVGLRNDNIDLWLPVGTDPTNGWRIPIPGSLDELFARHETFLRRLGSDGFAAPRPISCFDLVEYRRATDAPQRPFAVFALMRIDADGFRAFDPVRKGLTVAGMARRATRLAAKDAGWDEDKIAGCVLGHGEPRGAAYAAPGPHRFAYLPLPSIEPRPDAGRVATRIRRLMLTTFGQAMRREIAWAKSSLTAQELVEEHSGEAVALLSLLHHDDPVTRNYTRRSSTWITVTPVVLPGYDDPDHLRRKVSKGATAGQRRKLLERLSDRGDALIRKSIVQAGLSEDLAKHAHIEWRKVGFIAGTEHADRYGVPDHIRRFPRYHVRLRLRDAHGTPTDIAGPLCIGAGRFFGLGLFVAE